MKIEYCYNLAMRKSARIITHFYEERLATVGLKVGQFSILRAVNYTKKTTNKELQDILVLDQTTLSRAIKPLIRDELLNVSVNENDLRSKIISLSPKGKKVYQKALPLWQDAQSSLKTKLGNKQIDQILDLSESFLKKLA